MSNSLNDRLSAYADIAADLSVDAVALVPGPNFTRAVDHAFMSHERPFVLVIPARGPAAALVPNLELGSWDLVGFDGAVFDWRDQTGYDDAFAALTEHLNITSLAVEGQVMRVFVHHALKKAQPDLRIIVGVGGDDDGGLAARAVALGATRSPETRRPVLPTSMAFRACRA